MKSDKEDGLYGCWQELRVCCFLDRRHIVAGWLALTSHYTRTKTSLRFYVDEAETVKAAYVYIIWSDRLFSTLQLIAALARVRRPTQ